MKKDDQTFEVILSRGLVGQDDNIDILLSLFDNLQNATVEAAVSGLDLITFAQSTHYFAVILERPAAHTGAQTEQLLYDRQQEGEQKLLWDYNERDVRIPFIYFVLFVDLKYVCVWVWGGCFFSRS